MTPLVALCTCDPIFKYNYIYLFYLNFNRYTVFELKRDRARLCVATNVAMLGLYLFMYLLYVMSYPFVTCPEAVCREVREA